MQNIGGRKVGDAFDWGEKTTDEKPIFVKG